MMNVFINIHFIKTSDLIMNIKTWEIISFERFIVTYVRGILNLFLLLGSHFLYWGHQKLTVPKNPLILTICKKLQRWPPLSWWQRTAQKQVRDNKNTVLLRKGKCFCNCIETLKTKNVFTHLPNIIFRKYIRFHFFIMVLYRISSFIHSLMTLFKIWHS